MKSIGTYAKAVTSAAVAFVITLLGVKSGGITDAEWIQIIVSTAAAGGLTWAIPNSSSSVPPQPRR